MLRRLASLAVILALTVGVGSAATAASSLYKGSAQRLVPIPAQAGYTTVKVQAGGGTTRASASYLTPGNVAGATLGIRVLATDAAARASLAAACPGCGPVKKAGRASWNYRLRLEPGSAGGSSKLTVVASCRNLRLDLSQHPGGASKTVVDARARRVVDAVVARAVGFGMSSSCNAPSGGAPAPGSGSTYWTAAHAEETLTGKLSVPYCKVAPHDAECRQQPPLATTKATCKGQDAKPGTSTYARFACDILVGSESRPLRVSVWPTGASTFRWETI